MPMNSTMSVAQARIARVVASFERESRPLFVPDLVEALGLAGESSLTPTLKIMQRDGWLEIFGGGKQRAYRLVRLTAKGRYAAGLAGLPLLGSIPAGPLQEALSQPAEIVEPGQLLPHRPGDFLLRAAGDSMIGDGIHNGDLVLLRPEVEVQRGEIAAVHAGHDYGATLKHVFVEKNQVRLKASNPAYEDILVPAAEWRGVAGVYRGLVRHAGR
jgi:repressor LexA